MQSNTSFPRRSGVPFGSQSGDGSYDSQNEEISGGGKKGGRKGVGSAIRWRRA